MRTLDLKPCSVGSWDTKERRESFLGIVKLECYLISNYHQIIQVSQGDEICARWSLSQIIRYRLKSNSELQLEQAY